MEHERPLIYYRSITAMLPFPLYPNEKDTGCMENINF